MLKYLVVLLDDTSTSYCHHPNEKAIPHLIGLNDLKKGMVFAMKEDLIPQCVFPSFELPSEYKEVLKSVNHTTIVPANCQDPYLLSQADVTVVNCWDELSKMVIRSQCYVLRSTKYDLFSRYEELYEPLGKALRINIVITDMSLFDDEDFKIYEDILDKIGHKVESLFLKGKSVQLNVLTDRILLTEMNNCNAGSENITLAPDGKFYVCPAFYQSSAHTSIEIGSGNIGSLEDGIELKNPQLYKLSHAPLCRICDAYQCKRCVYLNKEATREVHIPGHTQCKIAHIERNASRKLLMRLREYGEFMPEVDIKEINYLDPFDIRIKW